MLIKNKKREESQLKVELFTKSANYKADLINLMKDAGYSREEIGVACDLLFDITSVGVSDELKPRWEKLDIGSKNYIIAVLSYKTARKIRNVLSNIPRDSFIKLLVGNIEATPFVLTNEEMKTVDSLLKGETPLTNDTWESLTDNQRASLIQEAEEEELNILFRYLGAIDFYKILMMLPIEVRIKILSKLDNVALEKMALEAFGADKVIDNITKILEGIPNYVGSLSGDDLGMISESLPGFREELKGIISCISQLEGMLENSDLDPEVRAKVEAKLKLAKALKLIQEMIIFFYETVKDNIISLQNNPPKSEEEYINRVGNAQAIIDEKWYGVEAKVAGLGFNAVDLVLGNGTYKEPSLNQSEAIIGEIGKLSTVNLQEIEVNEISLKKK